VELSQVWDIPLLSPALALALGSAYALADRVPLAVRLLEEAAQRHAQIRRTAGESPRLAALGHVYLMAGRRESAVPLAHRALAVARQHGERGHEAWALRLLGELALRADPPDLGEAEASCLASLELAGRLEMRPLVAHARADLAAVCRTLGRAGEADAHRAAAVALFDAMDMPRFADAARRAVRPPG
jgi:hypothetical protein